MAAADELIEDLGRQLQAMRSQLGSAYWQDPEVAMLQDRLRHAIGTYAAWSEDKLPLHQRARRAAGYESAYAALLWPGRGDD